MASRTEVATPRPRMKRPPEIASRAAVSMAVTALGRAYGLTIPVPTPTREVRARAAAHWAKAPAARYRSAIQTRRKPSASACAAAFTTSPTPNWAAESPSSMPSNRSAMSFSSLPNRAQRRRPNRAPRDSSGAGPHSRGLSSPRVVGMSSATVGWICTAR